MSLGRSSLLFSQLYFPDLPYWVCLLFSSPYFFFSLPPTTWYHFSLDSLSVSIVLPPFVHHWHPEPKLLFDIFVVDSTGLPWWSFCVESNCKWAAALQCNESGLCARGDVGALGEGEQWLEPVAAMKKLLCCVCCSPPEWYQLCWSANIVVHFWSQPHEIPSEESEGRMEWETRRWNRTFLDNNRRRRWMWVNVKDDWRMCKRELTGEGDEGSYGGLCCFSSLERNVAVMSRRQDGAWWHNPQTSTLRLPPAARILIKPSQPDELLQHDLSITNVSIWRLVANR